MSDWKPGEPISSRKLNQHSAARAQAEFAGPPGSVSKFGQNFGMVNHDLTNTGMWIRVTSSPVPSSVVVDGPTLQTVSLHSWEAIMWNDGLKKWQANPSNFGNATDDPNSTEAFDYDAVIAADLGNLTRTQDANLTANGVAQTGVKPYFAVRDPVSRRLIAVNPDGGGNVDATSTETVIMILGDYETYKDCPNVPAKPLGAQDICNGTYSTELCIPTYAYAVYQRCGYVWNKIGDTRTYQVWAQEMNGGTGANRRFHIPRWGGNLTATGPDPNSDCIGLAFLGTGGSALTCSCPPCLSSPPEGSCLKVRFTTLPRPADPDECAGLVNAMDVADAWGKDYEIELTLTGCSASGISADGVFTFSWGFQDGSTLDPCDWGPAVFDPCDPCVHWGRLFASIEVDGGAEPNCGGSGHWRGEFRVRDICELLCDCDNGPVTPLVSSMCNGCGNGQDPPDIWYAIDAQTVDVVCCSTFEAVSGGNAESAFTESYFGGNATSNFTESIYGGSE